MITYWGPMSKPLNELSSSSSSPVSSSVQYTFLVSDCDGKRSMVSILIREAAAYTYYKTLTQADSMKRRGVDEEFNVEGKE